MICELCGESVGCIHISTRTGDYKRRYLNEVVRVRRAVQRAIDERIAEINGTHFGPIERTPKVKRRED